MRFVARVVVGTLLALNVAAALVLFKPWGGSAEDLARRMSDLQRDLALRKANLARTQAIVGKIEKARAQGDAFMKQYMLQRRTAYSTIVSELDRMAVESGIKPKESQYTVEPIDGSDTLGLMMISASYEGPYAGITKFINQVDRSPRFLILESLQASPQATGALLNVTFKIDAFVEGAPGEIQ